MILMLNVSNRAQRLRLQQRHHSPAITLTNRRHRARTATPRFKFIPKKPPPQRIKFKLH